MRLQGKVALITGAASGIGYAISELFAKEGAAVFASDIAAPEKPYSEGIEAITLDVTSEDDWEAAVDSVIEKSGRLDVLINNAGIIAYERLDELDIKDWLRLIAVDQTGVFLGMREAVRVMRRQKSGSIVNISSIWGQRGGRRCTFLPRRQGCGPQHVEERGNDLCRRRNPRQLSASGIHPHAAYRRTGACAQRGRHHFDADEARRQADRGRLWLPFPCLGRGELHHRRRTGDRRRLPGPIAPPSRWHERVPRCTAFFIQGDRT
jgi:NAD(P)-dependent dehydrogenase (short-subunit alcohol dehydrogenase family)